jgi:hypothetical protein
MERPGGGVIFARTQLHVRRHLRASRFGGAAMRPVQKSSANQG